MALAAKYVATPEQMAFLEKVEDDARSEGILGEEGMKKLVKDAPWWGDKEFSVACMGYFWGLAYPKEFALESVWDEEFSFDVLEAYDLTVLPMAARSYKVCERAVIPPKQSSLNWVPEDILDKELCMKFVEAIGGNLEYVPRALVDREMCQKALDDSPFNISLFPEVKWAGLNLCYSEPPNTPKPQSVGKDLFKMAVEREPQVLKWVPEEMKDKDMCLKAVKANGEVLEYVPETLKDQELRDAVGETARR